MTIYWIPGHKEVLGNEKANKAIKKTIERPYTGKYLGISLVYV
jgi:hypothetical protein